MQFDEARRRLCAAGAILAGCTAVVHAASKSEAADLVYRGGIVYTVNARDDVEAAVAVRGGRIVYVGSDAGLAPFTNEKTRIVDLRGRMLMPGLVDGHMHPLQGGAALLKCSLNYEQLTVTRLQERIQACLEATHGEEPDGWLEVVNWFQEGMMPAGVVVGKTALDALRTRRPILVESSFGHTSLVNSRAIEIAGITARTADPLGGKIGRDAAGNPTGLLDDAAQKLVSDRLPKPTPDDDVRSAEAALDAMRKQGITTFLDAAAEPPALAAFARVARDGALTARAHFAVLVTPPEGRDPKAATLRVTELKQRYDGGPTQPVPGMTVHT
jgi:predicted amidohydrolase YtcJ